MFPEWCIQTVALVACYFESSGCKRSVVNPPVTVMLDGPALAGPFSYRISLHFA